MYVSLYFSSSSKDSSKHNCLYSVFFHLWGFFAGNIYARLCSVCWRILSCLFFKLIQGGYLRLSSSAAPSSGPLGDFHQTYFSLLRFSLLFGTPNWTRYSTRSRAEINNSFLWPAGCGSSGMTWDTLGHLCCQDTLLAHGQGAVQGDPTSFPAKLLHRHQSPPCTVAEACSSRDGLVKFPCIYLCWVLQTFCHIIFPTGLDPFKWQLCPSAFAVPALAPLQACWASQEN